MLKHASKRSIFFRYIVSFLVPVSMTVFLTLLSMWYLNNFVKDKNTKVFENVSQQINNELNDIFKEIDQVMISYATDLNFYKRLGSILGKYKLTYDELQTLRFCQNTIDISANIHPYIDSIYCIPYATQAQLNMLVSYDGTYVVENHSDATFIKNVINNQDDEGIVIRSISGGMLPEKRLISKYIKIQSIDGRRHKGLIIVNLDVKHIESVLNIHKQDQDKLFFITFKNQEMPVFYSSELKLIESSSLQEIVMDIENGRTVKIPLTDSITHSQRQTVVKYIPLDVISNEYGFSVYLMISKNALYSTSENLITMNIIVITVSIILGILIILLITHRKYSEIIKIDNYIDMLDNTPVFSIASEKNRKNIADYIKLHISERELNERKMEIQILKSQLNPHFLLNTLQMLNWSIMRELKGYSEINKVIGDLCKILSHSLYHGDSLSKLDEEIRYTNSYTTLQGYTKKLILK